jgi:hypothetical protein
VAVGTPAVAPVDWQELVAVPDTIRPDDIVLLHVLAGKGNITGGANGNGYLNLTLDTFGASSITVEVAAVLASCGTSRLLHFRHSRLDAHLGLDSRPYYTQCADAPNTNFAPDGDSALAFSTMLYWDRLPTSLRATGYTATIHAVPSPPLNGGIYHARIYPPANDTDLTTTLVAWANSSSNDPFMSASSGVYLIGQADNSPMDRLAIEFDMRPYGPANR